MNEEFIRKIQPIVDAINSHKIVDEAQAYETDETQTSAMSRLASLFASLVWECQSVYDLNANQGAVMVIAMNCVEQLANCLRLGQKLEIDSDANLIAMSESGPTVQTVGIKIFPGSRELIRVISRGKGIDKLTGYNSNADFNLYHDRLEGQIYSDKESPTFSIKFDPNGLWREKSISLDCTKNIDGNARQTYMIPAIKQKITTTIMSDNESRSECKSETYIDGEVKHSRSNQGVLFEATERCMPAIPYLNFYPNGYGLRTKAMGVVAEEILPLAFSKQYNAAVEKMAANREK